MAEVFSTTIFPENEEVIFVPETGAPGTPGTVGVKDTFKSASTTVTHQITEVNERFGYAQTYTDRIETVHEADFQMSGNIHANGLFAYALGQMCGSLSGGAADAVTGTVVPYTHALAVGTGSNRSCTSAIYHDTGDGAWLQLGWSTIYELSISWSPEAEATWSARWKCCFPAMATALYTGTGEVAYVAPPTGANLKQIGKDYPATPAMGYETNYSVQGSGGAYTDIIMGGQITMTRNVKTEYGTNPLAASYAGSTQGQRNPIDIVTNELMIKGSFDAKYSGLGASSMGRDALVFGKRGTSGSPQKVKFLDSDARTVELVMWPLSFDTSSLKDDGFRIVTLPFTVSNDKNTLLSGSGSSMLAVNIVNATPGTTTYVW